MIILCIISSGLSAIAQSADGQRRPIIDMHMHTGLPHEVPPGMPAICRPAPCEGEGQATTDPDALLQKTLEAMDRYNIVKGFLSGTDLSAVKQWTKAAPERFIGSPFVLKAGNPAVDKIRPMYTSGQFGGVGEIGAQLNGIPPNDPSLEPYFSSAAGSPLLLEDVLIRHPKLRIFVENAGYPYRDEMIAVMYQYPQLYADVSTISWVIPREAFYDYLKAFITAGLGKRIMFGSDQMVWPEKIGAAIEAIEQAPFLTEEQKRDIFYNNAVRFLGLDGTERSSAKAGMK